MNSMNARLKGFGLGGSKRKSSANNANSIPQHSSPQSLNGSLPQLPQRSGLAGPTSASGSTTSLPAMQQSGVVGRPPSYTQGYPPGMVGPPQNRTTSPQMPNPRTPPTQMMGGPPPINTAATGYAPPQHAPMQQGGPPMQGPPGVPPQYGGQAPYQGQGQQGMGPPAAYTRPGAVEVEGAGRSKSQLIVGIDFVSNYPTNIRLITD
jgi:hypothetical protein